MPYARTTSLVMKTSAVLIAAGGERQVYPSVNAVPATLRKMLQDTTSGANSATILIADQRGRREITKAMRALPGPSRRRLFDSVLGRQAPQVSWLTPARKRVILGLVLLMMLATLALVYAHRWH